MPSDHLVLGMSPIGITRESIRPLDDEIPDILRGQISPLASLRHLHLPHLLSGRRPKPDVLTFTIMITCRGMKETVLDIKAFDGDRWETRRLLGSNLLLGDSTLSAAIAARASIYMKLLSNK
jgi:hypothetical protein